MPDTLEHEGRMMVDHKALRTRAILAQSDLHRQRAVAEFILRTASAADRLLDIVSLCESGGHPSDSHQARQYIETKIREAFYDLLGGEFPVPRQPVYTIEAPATGIEPVRSPHTPARVPMQQV